MKIGINGYEAVVPRFGYNKETGLPNRVGSSLYCYQLLLNLEKIDKKNTYEIYLPQSPTSDMPKVTENWKYKVIPTRKMWTLTSLSFELLKNRSSLDVFFTPTHYLPLFAPKKSIVSILDVSYILFPNLFKKRDLIQLRKWTNFSAKKSMKILTISQSSKNDIIKEYRVGPNKVEVIYPGINTDLASNKDLSMEDLEKSFGIKNKFILFVGTLQPRKNIERLIEAFSKLETDVNLVIVGRRGWQYEEILNAPQKYNVKDRVLFLQNVGDEQLPSLYKNAQFFILPSLYEGFGIPVLEAMNYGCPVIVSNVSSLPEVGGDAVLYVDPSSSEDIAKKMQKLLDDGNLRKDLIQKGKKQVEKFSWEKSARETLAVLEEVANE